MIAQRSALAIAVALGAVGAASAQKTAAPVIEIDAKGDIRIAPDGHVDDYELKSELAPAVAKLVDHAVRSWRFVPIVVDGRPVVAKTTMSIHLHGEPVPDDSYKLSIASVNFGVLTRAKQKPPEYPRDAAQVGLGARVVLYLLIDASGKVVEAMPGQTSLDMRARSEREAESWRARFEKVSIQAAKQWRYDPSEFVDGKPASSRYAIAPIVFSIPHHESIAYVPGPVHPAPWDKNRADHKDDQRFAQLANGETASINSQFRLKDDVVGKTL